MKNTPITPYPFITNPDVSKIDTTITEQYIKEKMQNRFAFGIDNITSQGVYKLQGYIYDCRPFLKRYVYKQHNTWHESYALNKTNLKKLQGYNITEILCK